MPALSSSTLSLLEQSCPRALDLQEDGAPRDGQIFEVGTAAHAVLEAVQRAISQDRRGALSQERAHDIAAATGRELILGGRTFRGQPEPPLRAAAVTEGTDLALSALAADGFALPINARPELELAVNERWQPCDPHSPRAIWRGILDRVDLVTTDTGEDALEVLDYKTAWTADERLCDSLQLRGQLLLAHAHLPDLYPDVQPQLGLRTIHNLRTGQRHTLQSSLEDPALDLWRAQIAALAARAPQRGPANRPASPGPHCAGCVYRRSCTAADPDALDPDATAQRWAVYDAQATALARRVRAAAEHAPVAIGDRVYTAYAATRRIPDPAAASEIAALYGDRIIEALEPLLSVTGLERLARHAFTDPADRDDALARWLRTETTIAYGWRPLSPPTQDAP